MPTQPMWCQMLPGIAMDCSVMPSPQRDQCQCQCQCQCQQQQCWNSNSGIEVVLSMLSFVRQRRTSTFSLVVVGGGGRVGAQAMIKPVLYFTDPRVVLYWTNGVSLSVFAFAVAFVSSPFFCFPEFWGCDFVPVLPKPFGGVVCRCLPFFFWVTSSHFILAHFVPEGKY